MVCNGGNDRHNQRLLDLGLEGRVPVSFFCNLLSQDTFGLGFGHKLSLDGVTLSLGQLMLDSGTGFSLLLSDTLAVCTVLVVGAKDEVEVPEGGGVVVGEGHVMEVVVFSAGPQWEDVVEGPGEVVARVSVHGLPQTEDDPGVHRHNVEAASEVAVEERSTNGTHTEDQDFQRMRVLGGETERSGVFVMELVNPAVERSVVKGLVRDIVPCVFNDEEESNLKGHGLKVGEGNLERLHAEGDGQGVEQEDLRKFDGEMGEEHKFGAFPLLSSRWDFVWLQFPLSEVWHAVDDHPWNTSAKVHQLMKDEAHKPRCKYWVADKNIPCCPLFFKP